MISSFSSIGCMNIQKPTTIIGASKDTVVIIGTGNSYTYGYSTDLTTWTFGNIAATYNDFVPSYLCCGNVNSTPLWVVMGASSAATTTYLTSTSTNGTTWTTPTNNISGVFKSTGWINKLNFGYEMNGNPIFMATGYGGTSGLASVAISSDGITWKTGGFPFAATSFGNNCYYGNGYWVVVGNSGNTSTSVMYSSNVSISGNANITWSSTGQLFNSPAYGVAYTGSVWAIGATNGTYYVSLTNNPTSTYTLTQSSTGLPQFVGAIMSNGTETLVGGSGIRGGSVAFFPSVTSSSFIGSVFGGTRTCQIDYITTISTWIAALAGVSGSNNSFVYSTNAERLANAPRTAVSIVNTSMPVCLGVALAK